MAKPSKAVIDAARECLAGVTNRSQVCIWVTDDGTGFMAKGFADTYARENGGQDVHEFETAEALKEASTKGKPAKANKQK